MRQGRASSQLEVNGLSLLDCVLGSSVFSCFSVFLGGSSCHFIVVLYTVTAA